MGKEISETNINSKVKIYRNWNIFSIILIVILFFSILFLVLSRPMTGGGAKITMPELYNTIPLPERGELVSITILQRRGVPEVFASNKLVSDINKLPEIVERELNKTKERKVLILCDGKIKWRYLRNVLDLLKEQKITDIAFLSDKPAKGYDLIKYDFMRWKNRK